MNYGAKTPKEQCLRLYSAQLDNDYPAIKALLESGADPNGSIDGDCPFWELQYAPDDPQSEDTRIEIAKLFLIHGANPNLDPECDGETLYDYVMYKIFNEMSYPDWDYLLRFYKLLIAYGGGGYGYPRPALTEPVDKTLTDAYDILFEQCEDGYHIQGHVIAPDGKEIGTL